MDGKFTLIVIPLALQAINKICYSIHKYKVQFNVILVKWSNWRINYIFLLLFSLWFTFSNGTCVTHAGKNEKKISVFVSSKKKIYDEFLILCTCVIISFSSKVSHWLSKLGKSFNYWICWQKKLNTIMSVKVQILTARAALER